MKLSRLRGRKICDYVLRKGQAWKGKTMTIRFLMGPPPHPSVDPSARAIYVGTLASTRLDKSAVKRNRMRRRCREALRTVLREYQNLPTTQLLLVPHSSSLSAPFADIQNDIRSFLSRVSHGS